jgi:ribosomal-protein-alanine N-acetyltransferase
MSEPPPPNAPTPAFPQLQTSRLLLREITEADAMALLAIHSDADHMRYSGAEPMGDILTAKALVRLFASWRTQPNPGVRWGIAPKAAPEMLIGTCGLFAWNRAWRKAVVGYELARGAAGAGYMREALTAALAWGWRQMDLNRIEAQVHPHNSPSIKLLQGMGFVEEGCMRELAYWGGRHHDMLLFARLKGDGAAPARQGVP